jgi:hypothetical protein
MKFSTFFYYPGLFFRYKTKRYLLLSKFQRFSGVFFSGLLVFIMGVCPKHIYAFRNSPTDTPYTENKTYKLENSLLTASFNPTGLVRLFYQQINKSYYFEQDAFSITLNGKCISDKNFTLSSVNKEKEQLIYTWDNADYSIKVIYELQSSWAFISKQLEIKSKNQKSFKVDKICVLNETLRQSIIGDYSPQGWWPGYSTKNYGAFLRFGDKTGLLTLVQNPFLDYVRNGQNFTLTYSPDMDWSTDYGNFFSDKACLGGYSLTGRKILVNMVPEWKWTGGVIPDGITEDEAEIDAFTNCVKQFIRDHTPKPINVHVAWCENDFQEDVSVVSGREVYKRIIDQAASVGSKYIVYTPTTSNLGTYLDAADSWRGECFLWLGLGIKFRKNEWNPKTDSVPDFIQELLDYSKKRDVKLLAYVYPGMPFQQNKDWLVSVTEGGVKKIYANLGYRNFQDWLIDQLIAFKEKTGIGGYSFDYTFLYYPGKSVYAQWHGWCRVLEALRRRFPDIVIDGRQTYQYYGPWSWVDGSYPHPTSTDEQPESFVPFPDLHFDRSSADRERYTTFRYRIRDYCPSYLMPGYITHQTPRFNLDQKVVREPFRIRDWDYLGWKYSLISSIAMGGLNNVINMIPARDPEEFRNFSKTDKAFFRKWLDWTHANKKYLEHARPILGQPAIGKTDGAAAIIGNKGYIFLYNPNGRSLPAKFALDESIGLGKPGGFLLKEIYPADGKLLGKPGSGTWNYGDSVTIQMDGASAIALDVSPDEESSAPVLYNVRGHAEIRKNILFLDSVEGEKGTIREALVQIANKNKIDSVYINNTPVSFQQSGSKIKVTIHFQGDYFPHMNQLGIFDPNFTGGVYKASFNIPKRILDQLHERSLQWPISWYETDVATPYLLPQRLLLFVQIAEPSEDMEVQMQINGKPVALSKAYSSLRKISHDFLGFYADISSLTAGEQYNVELKLPILRSGQFQGLFFENIETEYTDKVVAR